MLRQDHGTGTRPCACLPKQLLDLLRLGIEVPLQHRHRPVPALRRQHADVHALGRHARQPFMPQVVPAEIQSVHVAAAGTPAATRASSWRASDWSAVLTRAYPSMPMSALPFRHALTGRIRHYPQDELHRAMAELGSRHAATPTTAAQVVMAKAA